MPRLTLAGETVPPLSRRIVRLPVAHDLTGSVDIVTHVVAGHEGGPTLLLLSMLHGNEWFSAVLLRELVARLEPAALRGNVLAVRPGGWAFGVANREDGRAGWVTA